MSGSAWCLHVCTWNKERVTRIRAVPLCRNRGKFLLHRREDGRQVETRTAWRVGHSNALLWSGNGTRTAFFRSLPSEIWTRDLIYDAPCCCRCGSNRQSLGLSRYARRWKYWEDVSVCRCDAGTCLRTHAPVFQYSATWFVDGGDAFDGLRKTKPHIVP